MRSLIIVGAGKHFGVELISRFASEGFAIGVVASEAATANALEQELLLRGHQIQAIGADLRDAANFSAKIKALAGRLPGLEAVIYNPKMSVPGSALTTCPRALSDALDVNITGAVVTVQALLSHLARASRAQVIFTGGTFKDRPDRQKFALAVGKAGLHGLAKSMMLELAPHGVAVKTIVINGAVRRAAPLASSDELAEFFWEVFTRRRGHAFSFPAAPKAQELNQLAMAV